MAWPLWKCGAFTKRYCCANAINMLSIVRFRLNVAVAMIRWSIKRMFEKCYRFSSKKSSNFQKPNYRDRNQQFPYVRLVRACSYSISFNSMGLSLNGQVQRNVICCNGAPHQPRKTVFKITNKRKMRPLYMKACYLIWYGNEKDMVHDIFLIFEIASSLYYDEHASNDLSGYVQINICFKMWSNQQIFYQKDNRLRFY